MPWIRDKYRDAIATWRNDLFRVTVRPLVIAGIFITMIDATRAVYNRSISYVAGSAIVWIFLAPFLYLWWRRNKA